MNIIPSLSDLCEPIATPDLNHKVLHRGLFYLGAATGLLLSFQSIEKSVTSINGVSKALYLTSVFTLGIAGMYSSMIAFWPMSAPFVCHMTISAFEK